MADLPPMTLHPMTLPPVTFKPVADFGLLVVFADTLSDAAHAHVLALDKALTAHMPHGVTELVPALVNLMVVFDPCVTDHAAVQSAIAPHLAQLNPQTTAGQTHTIDVCYDTAFAPDLAAVATATGQTPEAVINAHLSGDYSVLMFGFAPGYGYLGGVPPAIQTPRKPKAVPDVPAGSVMIAGPQCLITTLKMPTGWSVIGRSPTQVLTGSDTRPTLFGVGDRIAFNRISRSDFDRLAQAAPNT